MRGKVIDFGARAPEQTKVRTPFARVTGRPMVRTSLGSLLLDSGASDVTLFNVAGNSLMRETFTMTGPVKVGMAAKKLVIGSRTFWRGDAVTIPRSPESGATGLLPVSVFKTVYVCNSAGYLVLN